MTQPLRCQLHVSLPSKSRQKCLATLGGLFVVSYLPIFALSSGVYSLNFEVRLPWSHVRLQFNPPSVLCTLVSNTNFLSGESPTSHGEYTVLVFLEVQVLGGV